MSDGKVLVDQRDGYVVITLNRPDKLNAFTPSQSTSLMEALDEADDDPDCRAVVLTGAGRGFCAGQDLGEREPGGEAIDLGNTIETFYNPLIRRIRSLQLPVICAVNGVAAGAGANVALACDIVLAARSARFIQAFAKIGLVPDSGGTWTVTHLIGEARAKAIMLTGAPVDAETAEQWGMIWKAVDDDGLMSEAHEMASKFAKAATVGLGLTKTLIQAAGANDLDKQLDMERDAQRDAGYTPDYAEGVSAFLEKRPPAFTGRR
ncbi:2-(1,2-epoxy-1,2-dihydrophenyl)acetyl-CoA isomerase PaaG [Hoeflea prorocentri]|uniref:2-(1,2-epoxy-1,2-dihydrophenyl)acetyl-CoA isomerase PaaG n=1 Tax=Hoeflea prorocentri TaxID=1922333 RepID=A0A9X3ZGE9_9HYPH|nr:2-(1,2-epoxy-1,2-dihydrophenyl)acetyl-CoA isomerase PaaG [Hoeflea prorocentri]MCY6380697.1 2-(1,2-epoxy-1,2-dihydrophenyl)acetyl-CoA isomerase PaaG [Hoeflea prorocentri]MDA5398497.1 2-(1,2-epoxy-1,2-dihydrophenyl)acetyl-CoA isomerase PaaG [Hoeflea prorocentri]